MNFDSFVSLKGESRAKLRVKRSEFIATASHVPNEEEAREFMAKISDEFRNATHNCWAYKIRKIEYFSDAGEPSGTAGRPILSSVKALGIDKVCVVVTRYFGGVKLGVRGLREAYAAVSKMALESAQKEEYFIGKRVELKLEYADFDKMIYRFKKAGYFYRFPPQFAEDIKLTLFIPSNEEINFHFEKSLNEEVPLSSLTKI